MFGKMILPYFGSSPNVWNTCMVFYQACLLFGYLYAHVSIAILGVKKQSIVHLILILIPLIFLPIAIPENWYPPALQNPIPFVLMIMATTIGFPFFVLSATAPMVQKWFSSTGHKSAHDPYFLYVASNLGSMLILISYPFLVEPNLRLVQQSKFWQFLYLLFIVLIFLCVIFLLRSKGTPDLLENVSEGKNVQHSNLETSLSKEQRIRWILLSFVPSSLMLGVTTYISTDLSPVPLIWILPLVLYLLTFIIVFSVKPILKHEHMVFAMPYIVLFSLVYIFSNGRPIWFVFFLHLFVFFICTMVCHGELVRTRPSTKYLTEFYIWMSLGGCLGGIFNAIVAPIIFKEVIEYPLALIVACFLRPSQAKKEKESMLDYLLFFALIAFAIIGLKTLFEEIRNQNNNFLTNPYWLKQAIMYGVPAAFVAIKYHKNSIMFGTGIAAIILVYAFYLNEVKKPVYVGRNFFGIHRIYEDKSSGYISLHHNTTLHGSQRISEKDYCIPTTYYDPGGPIGQMFKVFIEDKTKKNIAVVGLGAGSLSCYGREDQTVVFYEIDPAIVKLTTEKDFFTYLEVSDPETFVVFGDGRLRFKRAKWHFYDFIILDAFSSDAIPVHLLTRESLRLYLSKLRKNGIIAFHTSNRYLRLPPVIGNLAKDLNLSSIVQYDQGDSYRTSSEWVLLARKKEYFKELVNDPRWRMLEGNPKLKMWTDDYSNIFEIFEFGKF